MTEDNPYQPPKSEVRTYERLDEKQFNHLAKGQKIIIYAIALYFFSIVVARALNPLVGGLIGLTAFVLGVIGFIRILLGSELNIYSKILVSIGMFIPMISLLALAYLNQKATKALRSAGYKVGFFGVKGEHVA